MSDHIDTEAVRATLTAHRNLWMTHPPAPLATSALLDAAVHAADLGLALCDELERTREAAERVIEAWDGPSSVDLHYALVALRAALTPEPKEGK